MHETMELTHIPIDTTQPDPSIDLDISIPLTKEQEVVQYVVDAHRSCKTSDHLFYIDIMMDNLYNIYGHDTWHKAWELIIRT